MRTVVLLLFTLIAAAAPADGQGLPIASPESVGLSSSRLQRLDKTIVAALMTQLLPSTGSDLHEKFSALVYQAVLAPAGTAVTPPAGNKARRARDTQ
jgi:hypothetical protein